MRSLGSARSAGCRSSRRSTRSCRWPRTCACSRGSRSSPIPRRRSTRMLEQTGLEERADEEVGRLSGGNQQRVNIAIGLLSEPPALLLDEPSASLDPRQRERLWEFIGGLAGRGTTVVFSTHNVAEAERYAGRVLVLADGELLFTGTAAELERAVSGRRRDRARGRSAATSRRRSCASCTSAATDAMRWLLVKDLQILRRSPLLVGLLVVYPIAIALMIGFALSSPPGKPKVALLQRGAAGPGQDPLRQPADQHLQVRQPSCSSRSSRSRSTPATEAIAQGQGRPGAGGADHPGRHPAADPEPGHAGGRQPDGRADPQREGPARAAVRRSRRSPSRLEPGRAGGLQAGAPGRGQRPPAGAQRRHAAISRARTSTCSG